MPLQITIPISNPEFITGRFADNHINKKDDYIYIFRTKYTHLPTRFDLTSIPIIVSSSEAKWMYKIGSNESVKDKTVFLIFKDRERYNAITTNPLSNPTEFLSKYGNGLIEIQSDSNLFFSAQFYFTLQATEPLLRVELLSVNGSDSLLRKTTSVRQHFVGNSINNNRIYCENGQTIRLEITGGILKYIDFEFYLDVLKKANQDKTWKEMGHYALTLSNSEAYYRLEPIAGMVHGKWPRYNDGEFVNVSNYKKKWDSDFFGIGLNLKQSVRNYINLSESEDNILGNFEIINPDTNALEYTLPLLDILNMSAMDYHIARMLGLGALDYDNEVLNSDDKFIYLLQYKSYENINNTDAKREVEHLSLSLPTSKQDQRLSLPVSVKEIVPGIITDSDEENNGNNLIADSGYTQDGYSRFVTLLAEPINELDIDKSFFYGNEINASTFTFPIYAGLEYSRTQSGEWIKPELSHNIEFWNVNKNGKLANCETVPITLSENKNILFVHKQKNNGTHFYGAYGINIFSRTSALSEVKTITTKFKPQNKLIAPTKINALLIREENPLFLTSQKEQELLSSITDNDKTLVRLIFEYNAQDETISYEIGSEYDSLSDKTIENDTTIFEDNEIFADKVEIFFRNKLPLTISGKVNKVYDDVNPLLCIVEADEYVMSTGQILSPNVTQEQSEHYIGGVFVLNDKRYVIHSIIPSAKTPQIKVYREKVSELLFVGGDTSAISLDLGNLGTPDNSSFDLFSAMENLQNTANWGAPLSSRIIKIGAVPINPSIYSNWKTKRIVITETDGDNNKKRYLRKIRGFFWEASADGYIDNVIIENLNTDNEGNQVQKGIYKLTFTNFLSHYNNTSEWYNGEILLSIRTGDIRVCTIIKTEQTSENILNLYVLDSTFRDNDEDNNIQDYHPIEKNQNGQPLLEWINYSPGYRIYLKTNVADKLLEKYILPSEGEGIRYSIFGLRSVNVDDNVFSSISTPVKMFAQEIIIPKQPILPLGAAYTTRPDTYGRATYTIQAQFEHKPNSIMFYRSDDELILNALYQKETVSYIRAQLVKIGGNSETYVKERWNDFFDFQRNTIEYKEFPDNGFKFPMPDNSKFIEFINSYISNENNKIVSIINLLEIIPNSLTPNNTRVIDFIREYIYTTFVSLTEFPIIYQYIRDYSYIPQPRKQRIKDSKGYLLSPSDPAFDMAPMARLSKSNSLKVLFTDFTIDATSDNLYFYCTQEINNLMKASKHSDILGPVKPVNTMPTKAPDIKGIMPVLENKLLGLSSAISFEINAYHPSFLIRKIVLYRAFNMLDAQSIRTMRKVKEIDLEEMGMMNEQIWEIHDEFEDLSEIPYNDALFYRIIVLSKVEYDEEGIITREYVPSNPSKVIATLIVESSLPETPVLDYTYNKMNITAQKMYNVVLNWNKTVYKGKYHLYKMNSQGNWEFIIDIDNASNDNNLNYFIGEVDLIDSDNNKIFHHYKIIAENTSGMLSKTENILTIKSN